MASHITRIVCKATMVVHVIFFIVCITVTAAQCRPVAKFWAIPPESVEGTCINTTVFFYFTSGFNILTDIFILALPVPTLLKINRPPKEKFALLCIFLLGTFATVMAMTRLHSIYTYTLAVDPFQQGILVRFPSTRPLSTPHSSCKY